MVAFVVLAEVARAAMPVPHQLSEDELASEMAQNRALAAYVKRNGPPDIAETRMLSDRPPWDAHEVVVYYLDRRTEMRFARASILGRSEVHTIRRERTLTEDEAAALRDRVGRRNLGPDERAEAAARRAENAASSTENAALAAERAADRTEAVTARMESAYHRALRK
jgi:hypothetical protein